VAAGCAARLDRYGADLVSNASQPEGNRQLALLASAEPIGDSPASRNVRHASF